MNMIDRWFPCAEVTEASFRPYGSGLIEKAMFPWFASRPIAQARAAVLATLLPWPEDLHEQEDLKRRVLSAVRGEPSALQDLSKRIGRDRPRVLDPFSGRGIIPMEATRAGAEAWGIDYSPVATLGGLLLADYPFRDWSAEPSLSFVVGGQLTAIASNRLLADVENLLKELANRHEAAMDEFYPKNDRGERPWGYLWARSIPCANCGLRYPLIGSTLLRHPAPQGRDPGQSIRVTADRSVGRVTIEAVDGSDGTPTFVAASGGGRGAKIARCPFCGHPHSGDAVKSRAADGALQDTLLLVADLDPRVGKHFRTPTEAELAAAARAAESLEGEIPFARGIPAVPDEVIPPGNHHTVRPSLYGARTYGDLCCARQTLALVRLCRIIRGMDRELNEAGLGEEYRRALLGYAGALIARKIRSSTRGATLNSRNDTNNRVYVDHIFKTQTAVSHSYDFFETGIGDGPGTLRSLAQDTVLVLRRICPAVPISPARIRQGSALRLPFRAGTVDALITDPPYYDMVAYLDASDLFFVWLKRALDDVFPELFGTGLALQTKDQEIIVKDEQTPGEHRTVEFFKSKLAEAFREAKRVLKPNGAMTLVFGHGDPGAWVLLLEALRDAGFAVTRSWPARTESDSSGGGANIKVTVTIACRAASQGRPSEMQAAVDHEVVRAVTESVRDWERDGLALPDQLMASYGPAMEVLGRYERVIRLKDGEDVPIRHYLALARRAVQDVVAMKVDGLPLETFDPPTRFALFWARLYPNRQAAPKCEAAFQAMASSLRLEDVRVGILEPDGQKGYRLARLDCEANPEAYPASPVYDVLRAMVSAWYADGGRGVAAVLARAGRDEDDAHLWAAASEIPKHLKPGDPDRTALEDIIRNLRAIGARRREVMRRVERDQTTLGLGEGKGD